VWVAVQNINLAGASVVSGQLMSLLSLSSVSAIPVTVTLPTFLTRYTYGTVCGAVSSFVVDDFTTNSRGTASAPTVTVSGGDVTTPFEADATFTISPASRSACVTVWEAVHWIDAPGASLRGGRSPSPVVRHRDLSTSVRCRCSSPRTCR
jgi:hypothetical protein